MLYKTRAIVLRTTKYSESSLVAHMLTEKFGMQSYLLNGVRKNKSKIKTASLQALHLLDLVAYHKAQGGLQRISELRNEPAFQSVPFDVVKSAVAIFMCDVIYHSLKEQESDEQMFDFLYNTILLLDLTNNNTANFPLLFLIRFSKYLGFYPSKATTSKHTYFDLREGIFLDIIPAHPFYLDKKQSDCLNQLTQLDLDDSEKLSIPSDVRKNLLQQLILYYEYHVSGFKGIKSHYVLHEVFA